MEELKITNRKISELIAAEYNPRRLTPTQKEQLKDSLKRFNIVDPVLINVHPERMNIIIGGHQRTKVWKELGNETIPCIELNLTLDKERELNVRLNKNTGEFDMEMLESHFDTEQLIEWGFEEDELDYFNPETLEAEEDEFDVPEGGIETDIVLGDLFEIGEHRLLCGSSLEIDNWDKLRDGQMFDLMVTDPPYNVSYEGKTKDALTIENDSMGDVDFYQFLHDYYTATFAVMKEGSPFYIWFADVEIVNFSKALIDSGYKLAQMIIWRKNSLVMGRKDYHFIHEPCLYGWKEGAAHKWYSDRKQTTILDFDRPSRNKEHPTMKPIPLISYQIGNSSKRGDLICDGFLGSGTTMVAAHQLKRRCYGTELDPKYCQVIVERMMKLDDTLTVKLNGKPYKKK